MINYTYIDTLNSLCISKLLTTLPKGKENFEEINYNLNKINKLICNNLKECFMNT